jgi:hypothetical protein
MFEAEQAESKRRGHTIHKVSSLRGAHEGAKCDICGLVVAGKLCLLRAEFNLQFELELLVTANGRANVGAPLAPPSLLEQLSMEIACYCRLEEDIYIGCV